MQIESKLTGILFQHGVGFKMLQIPVIHCELMFR